MIERPDMDEVGDEVRAYVEWLENENTLLSSIATRSGLCMRNIRMLVNATIKKNDGAWENRSVS